MARRKSTVQKQVEFQSIKQELETIINEATRLIDKEIARMYKYSTKNQSNSL